MSVRIVTDSTADLPAELVARHRIAVVPLLVQFGAQSFRDGVDLTPDAFYERLRTSAVFPTTSQPSLAAFQAVFDELLADGSSVVAVHLAATLSGTCQASATAAQAYPPGRVAVLDSRNVSMALGWLVLAAARAAADGAAHGEVVALIERLRPCARLLGALDTLEHLQRGGRIGRARAFLGSLLGIKPILEVRDGEVLPRERVRTWKRAVERLAELTLAWRPLAHVAIIHATAPEAAESLRARLAPHLDGRELLVRPIGPVLGTHIGPGALGVATLVGEP